jgi:hypothetical protein
MPPVPPYEELRRVLAALVALLGEHRRCGDLDDGVEGDRAWMSCTCGAVISQVWPRPIRQGEAQCLE